MVQVTEAGRLNSGPQTLNILSLGTIAGQHGLALVEDAAETPGTASARLLCCETYRALSRAQRKYGIRLLKQISILT